MSADDLVVFAYAGLCEEICRLFLPVARGVGTKYSQPVPFINDHPNFIMPTKSFRPFAPTAKSEALVRPGRQVRTVGVVDGFAGAFVVIPKPPGSIRHPKNARVNHAVGPKRKFSRIR